MKQILIILFTLFAIQGIAQDTANTVIMTVDYIEQSDSVSIQKKITYTYPNGQKMIREFPIVSDSIFLVQEAEIIEQLFEERQRLVEELQRLTIEINAIDVYIAESDMKFKKIKTKKDKK